MSISQHTHRHHLREKRRHLSLDKQKAASAVIAQKVLAHPHYQAAKTIAFYIAHDGEVDPRAILDQALCDQKKCHLPVLREVKKRQMDFMQFHSHDELIPNAYGILEPQNNAITNIKDLDLVLMPLVGFDAAGHRIGMGGGFYDTQFAFKLKNKNANPFLLGLAYACQALDKIEPNPWDVPVDQVVTEV